MEIPKGASQITKKTILWESPLIRATMLCENQKQLARMIKINLINCSDGVLSQFLKVYLTTQNALYNPNKIK
jgi:hypothetical protein